MGAIPLAWWVKLCALSDWLEGGSATTLGLPHLGRDPNRGCLWHAGPAEALRQPLEGVWRLWLQAELTAACSLPPFHVPFCPHPTVFLDSSLVHLEKVPRACDRLSFQPPPRSHWHCAVGGSSLGEEDRVSGLLGGDLHPSLSHPLPR